MERAGNDGLGIDLDIDGVTANDAGDADALANNRQNFPVIQSAVRSGTTNLVTLAGRLQSTLGQAFTIQCFVADQDASGHGEALRIIGRDDTVTTDGSGEAGFSCTPVAVAVGERGTVTATNDATGDTSEFSANVTVINGS